MNQKISDSAKSTISSAQAEIARLERALALALERRRRGCWDGKVDTERLIQRLEDIEGPQVGMPHAAQGSLLTAPEGVA